MSHYEGLHFKDLKEVEDLLEGHAHCWSCGSDDVTLESYPHGGGVDIGGKRCWVYLDCAACGYQTSLWKLHIQGLE